MVGEECFHNVTVYILCLVENLCKYMSSGMFLQCTCLARQL